MGFKDLFKKKDPVKEMPGAQEIDSGLKYRGIPIIITSDPEQSKAHIEEDYTVLNKEGIDQIVLKKFVPWLKGDQYAEGMIRRYLKVFLLTQRNTISEESSQNIHRQVKMLTSDSLNSILKAPVNILQICWKPVLCRYISKTKKSLKYPDMTSDEEVKWLG